jgi:TonB family protein
MIQITLRSFLLLLLLGLLAGICRAGNDNSVSSQSLVANALKLQNIWAEGTSPIAMRTEIQMTDAKGKIITGQYVVTWMSPSRWREQFEIADYKLLRVHEAKGYWEQSTLAFQPEFIFQLESMLDFSVALKVKAKQFLGKVKSSAKDGVQRSCTEVKWEKGTDRILCFDDASGNLIDVEFPRAERQTPPDISRIEYGAFNKIGDKRIPFEAKAFQGKKVILSAKVLDVTPVTEDQPALFVIPVHSEFWMRCDDLQDGDVAARVQPSYPISARQKREQGRAIFYAVIERDGTLSHLTVIQSASPELDAAAAEAVRQWRYTPPSCGSTAIRMVTAIAIDFFLQQ